MLVSGQGGPARRLPQSEHFSRPWRIHDLTPDFRIDDVWALPTPGGRDGFERLVHMVATSGERRQRFSVVSLLFAVREALGQVSGWDGQKAAADPTRPSLRERLSADLRDAKSTVQPAMGFTPLYETDDEWAAELINKIVHGVMHLSWVPDGAGGYRGQMAILVKPNGLLGQAYMATIKPFRYLIVYPQILEGIGRNWLSAKATTSAGR